MQTLFKHWVANNPFERTSVFELKLEKDNKPLSFDRVYDHQVAGLRQAKYKGVYHKIADQPAAWIKGKRVHFGGKKPFDGFFVKEADAYVVVMYYRPRETKLMYFIDIDRWVNEKETSVRKSLTEARAAEIAQWKRVLS